LSDSEHDHVERPGSVVSERVLPLLHERENYCEALKALYGRCDEEALANAAEIVSAYRNSPPLPPEYAEIIDKKFYAIEKERHDRTAAAAAELELRAAKAGELKQLVEAFAKLAAAPRLLPQRRELEKTAKAARRLAAELGDADALKLEFETADADVQARLVQEEAAAAEAMQALNLVAAELEALRELSPEEFKTRRAELESRRVAAEKALDPADGAAAELDARIRRLQKEGNARLTLHYQTIDLARWESYTLKMDLCKELEAMQSVPDAELPKAAKRLREIRQRWHDLGGVPREKQHELGPRYYEYTNGLQHRIDEHFKQLRLEQNKAEENKLRLCGEAEKLAGATDWNETGEKFKALQAEWKAAPRSTHEHEEKLYARFRAACNQFFDARAAYWKERDAQSSAVAELKARLCAAAEALAGLAPDEAARQAKNLRAEFNHAGRAGRSEAELNKRFDAAMDRVFSSRREELEKAAGEREAIVAELENLSAGNQPAAVEKRIRELRERWHALPPARDRTDKLEKRAAQAAERLEKELAEAKRVLELDREKNFIPALCALAEVVRALRRGESAPELAVDLGPFPKLAALATEIAGSGLPEQLGKALAKNTRDFRELVEKIEAAEKKSAPAVRDLAAELQAAIIGNSIGGEPVRREDPRELRAKLPTLGLPEPDELEALIARLEA
jgi:hypothetical protein